MLLSGLWGKIFGRLGSIFLSMFNLGVYNVYVYYVFSFIYKKIIKNFIVNYFIGGFELMFLLFIYDNNFVIGGFVN